jgi:hypothetical protein
MLHGTYIHEGVGVGCPRQVAGLVVLRCCLPDSDRAIRNFNELKVLLIPKKSEYIKSTAGR